MLNTAAYLNSKNNKESTQKPKDPKRTDQRQQTVALQRYEERTGQTREEGNEIAKEQKGVLSPKAILEVEKGTPSEGELPEKPH